MYKCMKICRGDTGTWGLIIGPNFRIERCLVQYFLACISLLDVYSYFSRRTTELEVTVTPIYFFMYWTKQYHVIIGCSLFDSKSEIPGKKLCIIVRQWKSLMRPAVYYQLKIKAILTQILHDLPTTLIARDVQETRVAETLRGIKIFQKIMVARSK